MKHIERHWQSFRDRVIPENAPEVQVTECRRAFYAGACITFGEVQRVTGRSDDEGVAHLEALQKEFEEYARDLLNGKA